MNVENVAIPELLTPREAAKILGVHPKVLLRLSRQGEGPPVVALSPRRLRFRSTTLKSYIVERERSTGPDMAA